VGSDEREYLPYFEPPIGGSHWLKIDRLIAQEIETRRNDKNWVPRTVAAEKKWGVLPPISIPAKMKG
jgi:hypothetical protein